MKNVITVLLPFVAATTLAEAPRPIFKISAMERNVYPVLQVPVPTTAKYLVVETDKMSNGEKISCGGTRPIMIYTSALREPIESKNIAESTPLRDPRAWIANDYVPSADGIIDHGHFDSGDGTNRPSEFQWVFRPSNGDSHRSFQWLGLVFHSLERSSDCGLWVFATDELPTGNLIQGTDATGELVTRIPGADELDLSALRTPAKAAPVYTWPKDLVPGQYAVKQYDNQTQFSSGLHTRWRQKYGKRTLSLRTLETETPDYEWVPAGTVGGPKMYQKVSETERIVQGQRWLRKTHVAQPVDMDFVCLPNRPVCVLDDEDGSVYGDMIELETGGKSFIIRHKIYAGRDKRYVLQRPAR